MRGKLRDKRSIAKRDGVERRRPEKRDKRTNWQPLQVDDDDDTIDDEEEEQEDDEKDIPAPKK